MLCAWFLRFSLKSSRSRRGSRRSRRTSQLLPIVTIVFPLAFAVQGLYRIRPTRSKAEEWLSVAIGSIVATVVLSGVLLWVRPGQSGRSLLARHAGDLPRLRDRLRHPRARHRPRDRRARHRAGKDLDRVLIAGSGELARAVVERMNAPSRRSVSASSAICATARSRSSTGSHASARSTRRSRSSPSTTSTMSSWRCRMRRREAMMALLDRLVRSVVAIHVVPDLLQFMVLRSRVEDLDGLPTINLSETPLEGWSRFVKRGFDLLVAAAALIVFSPVMLIVAIAIRLEDRGPIFYRQERMGLDGKPFEIVKFRSMRVGAENDTGAMWAEKDDPRRTRVGRFIRETGRSTSCRSSSTSSSAT